VHCTQRHEPEDCKARAASSLWTIVGADCKHSPGCIGLWRHELRGYAALPIKGGLGAVVHSVPRWHTDTLKLRAGRQDVTANTADANRVFKLGTRDKAAIHKLHEGCSAC
jgi:hypothetical protein